MVRSVIVSTVLILSLLSLSWAQESALTITDMKVEPSIVNAGERVLISCKVNHSLGLTEVEQVGAIAFHGNWVTTYPMLYDDGTHGDRVENDGVYSLEINAPATTGNTKIIFNAVDKDKNEIESEPIILTVE